ncbi:hypothetical protein CXB51_003691 [Gossypium anomalum]|uniref:Uncharacterized protein n=1 Tax=Gossypium anomalum TaxID=47600 RepID=A0A8J5Z421_9ROSI|nr:hypothetical protein CXB51_003691 [Gossypium anomalum]
MAEIGSVVLASQHAAKREFRYNGNPLPSELTVTVGSQQLTVRCRGNRDEYRIDGEDWCRFVRQNMRAVVTLYAREKGEGFHMVVYRK